MLSLKRFRFNPIREEKRNSGRWNFNKDLELDKKGLLTNHCGPCGYHNPDYYKDDTKYSNNLLKDEK